MKQSISPRDERMDCFVASEASTICQIVMATHSPMLMAYPNARLLRLSKYGLELVSVEQTDH